MANVAAVLKYGYYPTQAGIVPLIARYLVHYFSVYSSGSATDRCVLLDPCCGSGDALAELRDCLLAQIQTTADISRIFYPMGIELDAKRAKRAKDLFEYGEVIAGDAFDYMLTRKGAPGAYANLLYLNSPYDAFFPTAGEGDRYEISMLDHTLDFLDYNGVLVYIVRERLLKDYSADLTRVLDTHGMRAVRVYRYPEPVYSEYQQVVLFAQRKHSERASSDVGDFSVAGALDECAPKAGQFAYTSQKYSLSSTSSKSKLPKFYRLPDISAVEPFYSELFHFVGDPSQTSVFRPLTEIRTEHAILLAASGYLEGIQIGDSVFRGFNERMTITQRIEHDGDGDGYDEVETEVFVHTISILNLSTGAIRSINDHANPDEYESLMFEIAPLLLEQVRRMYRPVYEAPMADKYRDSFSWVRSSKRLPGMPGHQGELIEPQIQVAAAIVRGWETGRKVVTVGGEMSVGKTGISLAAAWHKMLHSRSKDGRDLRRLVVLCPASKPAVMKWVDEAKDLLGRENRSADDPRKEGGAGVFLLRTIADVNAMFAYDGPAIGVLAETSAKLTSGWTNVLDTLKPVLKRATVVCSTHNFPHKVAFPSDRAHCRMLRDEHQNYLLLHESEDVPVTAVIDKRDDTAETYIERDGVKHPVTTFRVQYEYRVGLLCPHCSKQIPPGSFTPRMYSNREKAYCPLCKSALWRVQSKKGSQARSLGQAVKDFDQLSAELRATRVPIWPVKARYPLMPPRKTADYVRLLRNLKMSAMRARKRLDAVRRRRGFDNPGGKVALAKYIRSQYRGQFGLIIDEAHDFRAQDSARGYVTMDLIESCRWAIQMTGTLSNGMASSIFFLMYRSNPTFRAQYGFTEAQKFVEMYGLQEKVTRFYGDSTKSSFSGYRQYDQAPSEIPGTHPGMASLLLEDSVFVTLSDLNYAMPDYTEFTMFVDMDEHLEGAYNKFVTDAGSVIRAALEDKSMREVSLAAHMRYRVLDRPTTFEQVSYGYADATFDLPLPDPDYIYPKEEAFLRIVLDQKAQGRPVLCFIGQINAGDPTPRLLRLMARFGLKGTVLRQDTTDDRVAFVTDSVLNQGCDVVFTSPKLVTVSVDLLHTPTIIWFGVAFETNLYEQANRRPWRLTQTRAVEVYYLAYQSTVQAAAFDYVARKIQAAVILQGRLVSGLAALRGGSSFVRNLQQLITHGETFDSDLGMDSFPPLPRLSKIEVVPPDLIQPYIPGWLRKRAQAQPVKYQYGICPHCQLPIEADEDRWSARYNGGIYFFHQTCVERTNHGTYVRVAVAA